MARRQWTAQSPAADDAVGLITGRSCASRGEANVEPVLWAGDVILRAWDGTHSMHLYRPVAECEGGARLAHRHF